MQNSARKAPNTANPALRLALRVAKGDGGAIDDEPAQAVEDGGAEAICQPVAIEEPPQLCAVAESRSPSEPTDTQDIIVELEKCAGGYFAIGEVFSPSW